jgi:hypothetical protein
VDSFEERVIGAQVSEWQSQKFIQKNIYNRKRVNK